MGQFGWLQIVFAGTAWRHNFLAVVLLPPLLMDLSLLLLLHYHVLEEGLGQHDPYFGEVAVFKIDCLQA